MKLDIRLRGFKKPIWAIIISIIFTAIIFSGGAYAYLRVNNNITLPLRDTVSSVYIDKTFNFSFILPANYYVVKNENYEGAHNVTIKLCKKINELTLDDSYISLTYTDLGINTNPGDLKDLIRDEVYDVLESTSIKVDGQAGIRYVVGGFDGGYMAFSVKNKGYVKFRAYPSHDPFIFDSIVSSFKFGN